MPKRTTLQDIAEKAGVGAGTVSRVLNNHPYVKDETRERVLQAIDELDYHPSFSARQMRTQNSRLIGFLTDEVATTAFAGDIIKGAQDVVWENDYVLLVIDTAAHPQRRDHAIKTFIEREVEGIIYAAMFHQPVNLPTSIAQVPTVLANCYAPDSSLPSVTPDEVRGGYEATKALLDAGHKRVAFINISHHNPLPPAAIGRLEGYQKALDEYDIAFDETLVCPGTGDAKEGYTFAHQLLQHPNPPTAIFCGTDRTAMGAYDAIKEQGLNIPDDIAIIGFDNQDSIASALRPGLTTMQLPHYDMGQWAVSYLMSNKDQSLDPIQHQLDCPLVERNSI